MKVAPNQRNMIDNIANSVWVAFALSNAALFGMTGMGILGSWKNVS